MSAPIVFAGPSVPATEVRDLLPGAACLPPAQRGDVYRACCDRPEAILVVDGYFESVPSVWHKEILYALSLGIPVYGASSMGAIRAAELQPMGMIGIGEVYEEMRAGRLDDDDVVVSHGPATTGYLALSTAMVNVRWSLRRAVAAEVVTPEVAATVDRVAKALYYPDRIFPTILAEAGRAGVDEDQLEALRRWLVTGAVDVKRDDAHRALRQVADDRVSGRRVRHRSFFPRTGFFEEVLASEERRSVGIEHMRAHTVVDQLRLDPDRYREVRRRAALRRAAIEVAVANGFRVDQQVINEVSDELRRELGLLEPTHVEEWLAARGMTWDDYAALVEREAHRRWGTRRLARWAEDDMLDELRLSGAFPELQARADREVDALAESGCDESGYAPGEEIDDDDLVAWFERRYPDVGDLGGLVEALDLPDSAAVLRLLRRARAAERAE